MLTSFHCIESTGKGEGEECHVTHRSITMIFFRRRSGIEEFRSNEADWGTYRTDAAISPAHANRHLEFFNYHGDCSCIWTIAKRIWCDRFICELYVVTRYPSLTPDLSILPCMRRAVGWLEGVHTRANLDGHPSFSLLNETIVQWIWEKPGISANEQSFAKRGIKKKKEKRNSQILHSST